MTETTQATVAVATPSYAKRKARALIGWLTPEEGALWLAGRDQKAASDPALLIRVQQFRATAAARLPVTGQPAVVSPLTTETDAHIAAFAANPWGARMLADAGTPMLVDLTKIRGMQPVVNIEEARTRVAGINPKDLGAIAALTIPVPPVQPDLQAMFDPSKQAHILASPNPNLRVLAQLSGIPIEIAPGMRVAGFGFAVALLPSVLNVIGVNGRYFLMDGYHRAIGLLESGITHVPALVREFGSAQEARIPANMLSADIFLGDRPPFLPDYLDANVSVETLSPLVTKMIVIQALEVTPLG